MRIPLERLDEIVKLVSELLISRTMSEQKLADLNRQVQELRLSTSRLQRVSQRLESDYEASALHGLRSAKLSPVIQQMSATAAFSSGSLLFQPQDTESAASGHKNQDRAGKNSSGSREEKSLTFPVSLEEARPEAPSPSNGIPCPRTPLCR